MRYMVEGFRADEDGNLLPPCEGAYLMTYDLIDVRTTSEEEFDVKGRLHGWSDAPWRAHGDRHRIRPDGRIERTFPGKGSAWFVDVDDLRTFVSKHGTIRLHRPDHTSDGCFQIDLPAHY